MLASRNVDADGSRLIFELLLKLAIPILQMQTFVVNAFSAILVAMLNVFRESSRLGRVVRVVG